MGNLMRVQKVSGVHVCESQNGKRKDSPGSNRGGALLRDSCLCNCNDHIRFGYHSMEEWYVGNRNEVGWPVSLGLESLLRWWDQSRGLHTDIERVVHAATNAETNALLPVTRERGFRGCY
jgi:hypothetical protein